MFVYHSLLLEDIFAVQRASPIMHYPLYQTLLVENVLADVNLHQHLVLPLLELLQAYRTLLPFHRGLAVRYLRQAPRNADVNQVLLITDQNLCDD